MKKYLIAIGSLLVVASPMVLLDSAGAAGPVLSSQCTVNGPVAGQGADDAFPCVNPASPYPPPAVQPPPVTEPPLTVPPGNLPATGSDAADPLVVGAFVGLIGVGLVLVARKRRHPSESAA